MIHMQIARRGSQRFGALAHCANVNARRASSATPLAAVSLRDGTRVVPLELSQGDRPKVEAFFQSLDPVPLSEAHGSFCALFSGVLGDTEASARTDMLHRFDHAVRSNHTAVGLVASSDAPVLAALSFHMPAHTQGDAQIYNLTVHHDFAGRGAAVALVRAQLDQARKSGYARMVICTGTLTEAGIAEQARRVVAIARRAAELSGLSVQFNADSGQVVIALS